MTPHFGIPTISQDECPMDYDGDNDDIVDNTKEIQEEINLDKKDNLDDEKAGNINED